MGSADATAVRCLAVEHLRSSLHDPLTGEVIHAPRFPFSLHGQLDRDNPHGMVYGDGAILLYNISHVGYDGGTPKFRAGLLRPGDTKWTLVERTLEYQIPKRHGGLCATYHGGKILVMEDSHWRVVTPGGPVSGDVLVRMPGSNYPSHSNYVFESHGELLWVSVHAWIGYTYGEEEGTSSRHRTFSVYVHALEEEASAPNKTRWVRKDGRSLADRVLFLGSPNSFAIDASLLGGHGGCAYFVYYNHRKALPRELFGVFRYNLVDHKTQFLERLPPGWDNEKCTWLVPQPAIAPIQVRTAILLIN